MKALLFVHSVKPGRFTLLHRVVVFDASRSSTQLVNVAYSVGKNVASANKKSSCTYASVAHVVVVCPLSLLHVVLQRGSDLLVVAGLPK